MSADSKTSRLVSQPLLNGQNLINEFDAFKFTIGGRLQAGGCGLRNKLVIG